MVYSDLIFFLGLMPVSVLVSFFDRSAEYKNLILILTSLVFICWAKPIRACLILLTIVSEYLLGLGIDKVRKKNRSSAAVLLFADLLINAGVFIWFGHNYLFENTSRLHLASAYIPVGAGYYTAKGFSYCLDVFRGKCRAEKNIFCLLTYMISYHSLLAGPVVRYGDLEPAIRRRTVTGQCINDGLNRFIIGLGKTVILAPMFAGIADVGLDPLERTPAGAIIGMLSFLAECWYSFTGLSDMAKALGKLSGFDYPDNYAELTTENGVTGFAKSANTTLIKLFEDFFGLFGENKGAAGSAFCLMIGAAAMGLWYYGGKVYFAVGAAFGLVLAAERLFLGDILKRLPRAVTAVYTGLVTFVIAGGLYFASFKDYKLWLGSTVGMNTSYTLSVSMREALLSNMLLILIAFVNVCTPVKHRFTEFCDSVGERSAAAYSAIRITKTILSAAVLFACVVTAAARTIDL